MTDRLPDDKSYLHPMHPVLTAQALSPWTGTVTVRDNRFGHCFEDIVTMTGDDHTVSGSTVDWRWKLAHVVETVREVSRHTEPQNMVRSYAAKMRQVVPADRIVSLSRRDLDLPKYRITRSSSWKEDVNPWTQKKKLPILDGGFLGELIFGDEPRIVDDLQIAAADPAAEYFAGQRSLIAIPLYDRNVALNMVVMMRKEPAAFDPEAFPDLVLASNLFGRATHNLVLSQELQKAYDLVDHESQVIADIQRSLLPAKLPDIPTMQLAAHYQTSRHAGGDYYDFFPLSCGKWGILLADVSGHGTPAAVLMAIAHSIAHADPEPPRLPSRMLTYLNDRLYQRYTNDSRTFITAFYGVYDPSSRELTYACAGHPPPRVKRCEDGSIFSLGQVGGLPLGIRGEEVYEQCTQVLQPGDQIILYTDGITEAQDRSGEMFGLARLDAVLEDCFWVATGLIGKLLDAVEEFTDGQPADDDRTVLVAKIS